MVTEAIEVSATHSGELSTPPESREISPSRRSDPRPAPPPPDLDRHQRKCHVCCHPEVAAIEEEFLHWRDPWYTAQHYQVSERSIYRHAHALGLFARRRENLHFILDQILQRVGSCRVTADSVIRAVRAYTCLTDDGEWIEPAKRFIVSSASTGQAGELPAVRKDGRDEKGRFTRQPELGEGIEREGSR